MAASPKDLTNPSPNWQGYPVNPLKGVLQLLAFQKAVRKLLPRIHQPLLVVQGRLDKTVHPSVGEMILQGISSPVKALHWMENSTHIVLLDQEIDEITRLTSEATAAVHGYELLHIGINSRDGAEALKTAEILAGFFKMPVKDGNSSAFVGKPFEIMKHSRIGAHGHIAMAVTSVERAAAAFRRRGIGLLEDTVKIEGGVMKVAYLDTEVAGFALHLSRK